MTTTNPSPGRAATDADLVRYLDGELSAAERAALEAVLATDAASAARLEQLRRRSRRLHTLLAAADPVADTSVQPAVDVPEPHAAAPAAAARPVLSLGEVRAARTGAAAGSGRVWLRAAIFIGVLLTGVFAVPPVRAWVLDRLDHVLHGSGDAAAASPAPLLPAVEPDPGLGISFPAAGASFDIELTRAQSGGRLALRAGRADSAGIVIRGNGVSTLKLPQGVRIENATAATASYTVTVPASAQRVTVRVPGRPLLTFTHEQLAQQPVIELGRTAPPGR